MKDFEKELLELKNEISALRLENQVLEKRIKDLEEGSVGTGVYLDGCPEYAKEYIIDKKEGDE